MRPFQDEILTITRNGNADLHIFCSNLSDSLFHGLQWRGFEEIPQTVIVIRLVAGNSEYQLVLGLNPRKKYDGDFEQFMELLARQLATSLTSADLMDQAKANQAMLSKRVVEGEARFRIMTETNPGGMFYLSPVGEVLYANDTCNDKHLIVRSHRLIPAGYSMTGHARDHRAPL